MNSLRALSLITICLMLMATIGGRRMSIYHPNHPKVVKNYSYLVSKDQTMVGVVNFVNFQYLVPFDAPGQPEMLLVFDTGSSFIWVEAYNCTRCLPDQPDIIEGRYNYSNDQLLGCNNFSSICDDMCQHSIPNMECYEDSNTISYNTAYEDGSGSSGNVVVGVFNPFVDKTINVTLIFGIGRNNICSPPTSCYQGMAGFGAGLLTLPAQLKPPPSRWGFCLPYDGLMEGSILIGDEAIIPDDYRTTRIYEYYGIYVTNISNIYVSGAQQLVNHAVSMAVVDTGSTATYLEEAIFDELISSIRLFLKVKSHAIPVPTPNPESLDVCYLRPYPVDITFELGDIHINVSDTNLWYQMNDGCHCLTIRSHRMGGLNVIGNFHVRGYTVAYDLSNPSELYMEMSTSRDDNNSCLTQV